jgi:glycosyltransferase involved in cell wall biosynthesis
MRIMEVISGARVNGAILHCLLLARELTRRGHEVILVCLPGAWIGRQAASAGIEVIPSDLHRWPPDELRRVAHLARQRQIDVIHTHTSRSNFFGILLRWFSGIPSVATAHSRHFQLHWMFNDGVIAVSEANRRYQRTHNFVRADRIETIHNSIDWRRFADVPGDARQNVRAWLGAADDDLVLGIVGSIIPRKGLIYLVRAMAAVVSRLPKTHLLVVGGDTQSDYGIRVRSEAKRLGVSSHITWMGPRSDVETILPALDLYVLPSLEESFPLSILEAMAAGLPVIATDVGGISEGVVADQTGLLVPPGREDLLADAIIRLAGDPQRRRRFGEAGRRRVLEHFSAESQTPAIEAAFSRVLRRRAAA